MRGKWDGFTLVQRTLSWTSVGQILGPDLPLNDLRAGWGAWVVQLVQLLTLDLISSLHLSCEFKPTLNKKKQNKKNPMEPAVYLALMRRAGLSLEETDV